MMIMMTLMVGDGDDSTMAVMVSGDDRQQLMADDDGDVDCHSDNDDGDVGDDSIVTMITMVTMIW